MTNAGDLCRIRAPSSPRRLMTIFESLEDEPDEPPACVRASAATSFTILQYLPRGI
jgi:hypothetical protein